MGLVSHRVDIATPRQFRIRDHGLAVHCTHCERWHDVDLTYLVTVGRGDTPINQLRFRCRVCGQLATKQVRPPVPGIETYGPPS